MKKRVLWISVVLLALIATALWLGSRRRVRPSFPMPPLVRPEADVPVADRKDDELWRKTPEAQAAWNEIRWTTRIVEFDGKPLTTNQAAVLIVYMQSPHYFARWKAVIAAGTARSDPARSMLLPHVISLLSDPVYIVRIYAADALEFIGDKSTIPFLEPLLDDHNPAVASTALEAIKKLQQKEAVPGK